MNRALLLAVCLAGVMVQTTFGDDGERLLSIDHYVRVRSTVPAIAGQAAQIYVRERAKAGTVLRASALADRVVLFVHGAGTPAEVAFDATPEGYSWMAYLANADFDAFSMDMTGYGRSTRPAVMNDPCNLNPAEQSELVPSLLSAPCTPTYSQPLTTIASDWDDLNAVVDYLRALRHVDKVSLVAWSLGGPRTIGYAAQHPEKISRLVVLAPAYNAGPPATAPAAAPRVPAPQAVAFNTQSHAEFVTNWDNQVGCPAQYEPAVSAAVWSEMLASDPVGATWGGGMRRAPNTSTTGWTAMVAKTKTPILMIAGAHDRQVPPARVQQLYADIGAPKKVLIDLACSGHNAMWEKNHALMFRASLEWLVKGTVNGLQEGTVRLGY